MQAIKLNVNIVHNSLWLVVNYIPLFSHFIHHICYHHILLFSSKNVTTFSYLTVQLSMFILIWVTCHHQLIIKYLSLTHVSVISVTILASTNKWSLSLFHILISHFLILHFHLIAIWVNFLASTSKWSLIIYHFLIIHWLTLHCHFAIWVTCIAFTQLMLKFHITCEKGVKWFCSMQRQVVLYMSTCAVQNGLHYLLALYED